MANPTPGGAAVPEQPVKPAVTPRPARSVSPAESAPPVLPAKRSPSGKPTAPAKAPGVGARWRGRLIAAGLVLIVLAVALEIVALFRHSTQVVVRDSTVTAITTTHTDNGPAAPPTALVTALGVVGVVLILVGVFYDRITKITVSGVEVDLATYVAGSAAAVSGGDPDTARQLVDLVLGSGSGPAEVARRVSAESDDLTPLETFMATAIAQRLVKTPSSWS